MSGCSRCHDCGMSLSSDEWCESCRAFRRYHEHGWGTPAGTPGGRCYGAADTISCIFQFPRSSAAVVTLITKGTATRA